MIVKGTELLCREGCQNNPLTTLQVFAYDHKEKFKGGWFLVIGKEELLEEEISLSVEEDWEISFSILSISLR